MRTAAVKNLTINVVAATSTTEDRCILTNSSAGQYSTRVYIDNVTIDYSKVTTTAACYVIGNSSITYKTMGNYTKFSNVNIIAGSVNAASGNVFANVATSLGSVTFENTTVSTTSTGALMSHVASSGANSGKYVAYYASNDTLPTSGDGSTAETPINVALTGITRTAYQATV